MFDQKHEVFNLMWKTSPEVYFGCKNIVHSLNIIKESLT